MNKGELCYRTKPTWVRLGIEAWRHVVYWCGEYSASFTCPANRYTRIIDDEHYESFIRNLP